MQRVLIIIAKGSLLFGAVLPTRCFAEAQKADTKVTVADSKLLAPERWLNFKTAAPRPMAVRPDGRQIVVKTACETVLYDLGLGDRLHTWTGRVSVGFSANGRFLLAVEGDDVSVWQTEPLVEVRRFSGRAPAWNEPNYQSFSPGAAVSEDGSQLAIANRRGSFHRDMPAAVLVYDTRSGELRQTLATPEKTEVKSVAAVPNSKNFLVGYGSRRENENGKTFHALWDTQSGNLVREFPLEADIRLSPDGRWIAGGTLAGSPYQWFGGKPRIDSTRLTIWETDFGQSVRTIKYDAPMRDFTFSPNSERILAAMEMSSDGGRRLAYTGRVVEWDVQSGETRFEADDATKPYASIAYSPDGRRRFATTERPNGLDYDVDHQLCGWNVETGRKLPIGDYRFASYNGDENLFFDGKGDRFIDLACSFSIRNVRTGVVEQTLPQYRIGMTEIAFTPDGERFLVGPCEAMGACYLTDCRSGNQRILHLRGKGPVFLDGGRKVFAYDFTHLHLIDVASNKVAWRLDLHGEYRRFDAAISPDGTHVVVSQESDPDLASAARVILLHSSGPGRTRTLERYAAAVAFRPDGARYLVASPEAIDEFDALSGEHIRTLWTPPGRPLAATYSQDGTKVLAGGVVGHADRREPVGRNDQGWALIWDSTTNGAVSLQGHTAPVTTVAYGGGRCATGSLDTTIRLWDTTSGSALAVLRGHIGGVHRIAYSQRGDRILSAAEDGAAIWNVSPFATPPVEPIPLADSFRPEAIR